MIINLQNVDSFTTSYALKIILKHFFFKPILNHLMSYVNSTIHTDIMYSRSNNTNPNWPYQPTYTHLFAVILPRAIIGQLISISRNGITFKAFFV